MRGFFEDCKINGNPILVPDAEVELEWNDLDSSTSGRDESGVMHRKVLRHRVPKFSFSYSTLTRQELAYMHGLVKGLVSFQFTYRDMEGTLQTIKAYNASDSVTWYDAQRGVYKNYKLSIIGC